MLSKYLTARARWQPRAGTDRYGQPQFGEGGVIACRIERGEALESAPDAERFGSRTVYFTAARVSPGDLLDGRAVVSVETWAGFSPRVIGYRAVV